MLKNGKVQKWCALGVLATSYVYMSYAVWYDRQNLEAQELEKARIRAENMKKAQQMTREDYEQVVEAFKKRHGYS